MNTFRRYALLLACVPPLVMYAYVLMAMCRVTAHDWPELQPSEVVGNIALAIVMIGAAALTIYVAVRIYRNTDPAPLRGLNLLIAHAQIFVGTFCWFFMVAFVQSAFKTTRHELSRELPDSFGVAGIIGSTIGMTIGVLIGIAFIYIFGKWGYEAWWGVPKTLSNTKDPATPSADHPQSVPDVS